jgi:hypothetical protein
LIVVTDIFVCRRASESKDPYALVEEAHGFHDKMAGWYYRSEELAEELFWSVAVNEFVGQIHNGGGAQYVMNRHWTTREVSAVRTGLRAMGATAHLDWFEWLAAQVAALAGDIPRFLESPGFGDKDVHDALCHRDRDFYALDRRDSIHPIHSRWLRSLPSLKVLDKDDFDAKMHELVESVPDYRARAEASLYRGHWQSQMLKLLCWKTGQRFHSFNGLRADLKNLIGYRSVTLTRGAHEVTEYLDRSELRDPAGALIATVEANEVRSASKRRH